MSRLLVHGLASLVLGALLVGVTAGVSDAKATHVLTPTLKSALTSATVTVGSGDVDTATVTGKARGGAPTGTVTFYACGPTAAATPCTSPNFGPATVTLTPGPHHASTATENITPTTAGWYCFLDDYNGDTHYKPVSDNATATECLDATGTTNPTTPTLRTSVSPQSIPFGSTAVDTATVTGNATYGSPTGTLTFAACGPTAGPVACTSPTIGPATAGLSATSGNSSTASVTIGPGAPGWYCFLDRYSGDAHYSSVSDNDTASECLDVTSSSGGGPTLPTLRTSVSPQSIPFGSTAVDTATVTGNATYGSPTGTLTFAACGPTAGPVACTSPTIGPATAGLSATSGNSSTASVTIGPGAPGWYCFLDRYSGDAHYSSVSDNDTASECLDVTSSSGGPSKATARHAQAATVLTPVTPGS